MLTSAQNTPVTISVDANAQRIPINPGIYGLSFADGATLQDLNSPLDRSGGNAATGYNWQINASNRASDYFFESIGSTNANPGYDGDAFVSDAKTAHAQAMLTIPILDWVARLGPNRAKLASFSQAKYGAQTASDYWFPDAGNGTLASNGQSVTSNDPNDAYTPNNSIIEQGWEQHLISQFGTAANGGLRYYILDNEPSIWHQTHRDVHPTGATMDELKSRILDYSAKIKAIDSGAKIVGPEEWGWSGYLFSGYDLQYGSTHGWGYLPDRSNHGGADYLPWLLGQLKSAGHPLDVFSLHFYPQGGEYSDDTSTNTQLLRNRSTRALWDPNYVNESWINDKVMLIPRMKSWVNAYYYPNTPTAITEYNWGAEGSMNGATTQADILGIFGREGLTMATRWTVPGATTPTYQAIKMYRNYDGNKSTFGETNVLASVPNPDQVSSFAATRAKDGALTVVVINKQLTTSASAMVVTKNFVPSAPVSVYQLSGSNSAIQHLANISPIGGHWTATLPAQSVTLFIVGGKRAVANIAAGEPEQNSDLEQ